MSEPISDKIQKAISNIGPAGARKAAEVIARSFYRDMKKYGFTDQQIIYVSAEIINCLSKSLAGYKEKIQMENKPEDGVE